MQWLWWVFIDVVLAVLPGYIASTHGRSFFRWWVYGVFLLPVAFVHSLLLSQIGGSKQCGYCRTMVPANSEFCPRCGYEFMDAHDGEREL